ncbi:hypothetical protein A3H87_01495 [Candidatus Curtissbacteria bacterium RIFCSPLOWO2_02_FULL_42_37]|uniref:Uncharacterized protein n=1 Tax=Candidatus Curtissbacteria bacterium RIFCSPLOWO2_01_FULL_42_50 TaxID=1797730 RepID=A0A1F5H384_9BACT|nr:MAG: hypothetical protein A3B54_05420 [Candidatus Curtissbacteria bacterium RIFCSPLOWO2_01_FULL_42_50]OGE11196.1 MAG: hypothetical protein A3H87_01495 [Candidatus Curtissbacteria bacterium RIFCSPLOWO2_02_FULL_42_37]
MRINRRKKAKPNFRGFFVFHRTDKELIKQGGSALLGAYYAFVSEADWDKRHSETYGRILKTDAEIAEGWGCDSTTVARYRKKLIEYGLLEIDDNGYLRVKNFERFEIPVAYKLAKYNQQNQQVESVKLQEILTNMPVKNARLQKNYGYISSKDFGGTLRGNLGGDLGDEFSDETDLLEDLPV